MEEKNMKKLATIEVGEKEYKLGYPTPKDALRAEEEGLDVTNTNKTFTMVSKLFYTGLLAKQPKTTEDEALEIMTQYVEEDGDLEEITKFLTVEFVGFITTLNGQKKKTKKMKIIQM